jgi:hypothetical protein
MHMVAIRLPEARLVLGAASSLIGGQCPAAYQAIVDRFASFTYCIDSAVETVTRMVAEVSG